MTITRAAKLAPTKSAKEVTGEYTKEITVIIYHPGRRPRVSTYSLPDGYGSKQEAVREAIRQAMEWAIAQYTRTGAEAVYVQEVTIHGTAYTIGAWE